MRGWELGLLAAVALLLRLVHLDHAPHFDELYHVLAAQSWAVDGSLRLADGVYERGSLFTVLVGLLYRVFDDTLVVGRLPSLAAGTLAVVAVGWWTAAHAGRAAGWIAALFLCFDPVSIYNSQLVRFYALHTLVFLLLAALWYGLFREGADGSTRSRAGVAALVAVAIAVAAHLQESTLIGMTGIALWTAGRVGRWWRRTRGNHPRWRWIALGCLGVAAAGVLWAIDVDLPASLWHKYRASPLWSAPRVDHFRYYAWLLGGQYPVLIGLFPVAVLLAWRQQRGLAVFATVVFTTALVLHSFAGRKAERYVAYAMPFFFVVAGLAVSAVLPGFRRLVDDAVASLLPGRALPGLRAAMRWSVVAAVVLVAAYNTPGLTTTRYLLLKDELRRPYANAPWPRAASQLRSLADSADVVISNALPKSLYYLGRGDVTLSASQLGELGRRGRPPLEFTIDYRTGRPTISAPASIASLMACHRTGLVVVERTHWREAFGVSAEVADALEQNTEAIALPPEWRLLAFRWRHPAGWAPAPCPVPVRR